MDLMQAVKERHSVRKYADKAINEQLRGQIVEEIAKCNQESGLNIQAVFDEEKAFDCFMARYGKFSGVKNYIVLAGEKGKDEQVGYYGERLVIFMQSLSLNSCWVALTYKKIKGAYSLNKGEKVYCVLAFGYGENGGAEHKIKPMEKVANVENAPEWFLKGVECALLAPTAMNQQKFRFSVDGDEVQLKAGSGFYTKIDAGIVKYHFELAVGKDNFVWKQN